MTGHNAQDESKLDTLLLESGQGNAPELKQVLRELRSLASGAAPAPSAELQALLSPGTMAPTGAGTPTRHLSSVPSVPSASSVPSPSDRPSLSSQSTLPAPTPLRRRHRGAVISLTVAAAMGLGAGAAAAANEDFRGAAQQIISGIVQTVIPHPDPASPQPGHKAPAVPTPAGPPAVAPSGAPSQNPAGQPGAAVPSAVPGAAEPSSPSSQRASSPPQVPGLPVQAAHNLPGWLVPPLPPLVPPAVGNDGKPAPVPDPLGGSILGHTPPAVPGHK